MSRTSTVVAHARPSGSVVVAVHDELGRLPAITSSTIGSGALGRMELADLAALVGAAALKKRKMTDSSPCGAHVREEALEAALLAPYG